MEVMKTRVFTAALIGLAACASIAMANDRASVASTAALSSTVKLTSATDAADAQPLACFKLEQPASSCAIVGKPIVNYVAPAFNVIDLNGAWTGPGGERPYIYFYGDSQYSSGYTIMVDMTLLNRPDAFGYMVDASTIAVVFPDDRDYTGTLENNATSIRWSNNSVWSKL
jgi:hypothetical protein